MAKKARWVWEGLLEGEMSLVGLGSFDTRKVRLRVSG